jgi:hypothetical protein
MLSSEPVARSSNRDQCLPTTFVSEDQKGIPGFHTERESLQALEPESLSNPYQFTGTTGVESICEQVSKDDGFCVNSCTQQHVTG